MIRPALLFFLLPVLLIAQQTNKAPLMFSAMGCGPYTPADAEAIRFYVARENAMKRPSAFLVHLGDINSGKDARAGLTDEQTYINMKNLLTASNDIPAYIVVGDNEWNDHADPKQAMAWWNAHLLRLEELQPPAWETHRQNVRPENFAFTHAGVLFIGINLVAGRIHDKKEWPRRFQQNNDWIERQLAAHASEVRATVVFFQANPVGQGKPAKQVNNTFRPFCDRLSRLCAIFQKPVLLLHADGHKWLVDHPWEDAPNITRVQLDRINVQFPPVRFTVTHSKAEPFRFDRRLDKPWWKVPQ